MYFSAAERHPEAQDTGTQVSQITELLSYETTVYDTYESDFMNSAGNMDKGSVPDIRMSPGNNFGNTIEQTVSTPGSYCTFAPLRYKHY